MKKSESTAITTTITAIVFAFSILLMGENASYGIYYGSPLENIFYSQLVHANFFHLFANMFIFFITAGNLETLNKPLLVVSVVLSMICSGILGYEYINLTSDHETIALGFSGVAVGVITSLVLYNGGSIFSKPFFSWIIELIVIHIVMIPILHMPIAWYMHLGGFIGGILAFQLLKQTLIFSKKEI